MAFCAKLGPNGWVCGMTKFSAEVNGAIRHGYRLHYGEDQFGRLPVAEAVELLNRRCDQSHVLKEVRVLRRLVEVHAALRHQFQFRCQRVEGEYFVFEDPWALFWA